VTPIRIQIAKQTLRKILSVERSDRHLFPVEKVNVFQYYQMLAYRKKHFELIGTIVPNVAERAIFRPQNCHLSIHNLQIANPVSAVWSVFPKYLT